MLIAPNPPCVTSVTLIPQDPKHWPVGNQLAELHPEWPSSPLSTILEALRRKIRKSGQVQKVVQQVRHTDLAHRLSLVPDTSVEPLDDCWAEPGVLKTKTKQNKGTTKKRGNKEKTIKKITKHSLQSSLGDSVFLSLFLSVSFSTFPFSSSSSLLSIPFVYHLHTYLQFFLLL